ncbi:MAG: ABC transporter permease [Candidatus Latescibacteria bacterium]|nr:ABC transporter permease [Candidatus Latescibacterota bacterium]
MRFALYIARRHLRSRRRSRFVNRVTVTAIAGITIGVMVLDLTLAIMNGLHVELRSTFVDNMPMVTIVSTRPEGLRDVGSIMDRIGAVPGVEGVAPFVRQEVVVSFGRRGVPAQHRASVVWGVDPDLQEAVTPLSRHLLPPQASLRALRGGDGVPAVVVGAELAASLYAGLGDTLVITAPRGELDLQNLASESRRFVVAGFLDTGLYDFDARFVYMPLAAAQEFFGYESDGVTAIGVRSADMMAAPELGEAIRRELGPFDYAANDWIALNRNLFDWVRYEKVMMFVLLGLVILVAAFNIVGILTMMVGERRREIGILLSMGARRRQIQTIFLLEGCYVGIWGTALGTLLGWLGTVYLDKVGIRIPGDVYFMDHVPVVAQAGDFLGVAAAALVITLLATLLPSGEAARLRPMDIIRYT